MPLADVDWTIKYLYAQNQQKGVGHVRADSAGPALILETFPVVTGRSHHGGEYA